ncbi:potassium transporter Kup [Candidatus Viadribacter manganicus]|uniref:Probable potassium transport system protein Kup n=1 Tax=Candidatus Viadribacter manganicus TaxID=1759059 RepID=A0A1B1AN82_9PROT|nr:potassium transporter Kup [Candidatus Viadribacter manganicus]ANP48032.1 potassium transport protein Kup [Candidatus Viadribacter manganicus]
MSTLTHAPTAAANLPDASKRGFWGLTLAAIGVVYGDIGTSPLYAFRESIGHVVRENGAATNGEIIGVISLMLWALIAIVTIKYATILLRLDNRGEGGTLSLMALVQRALGKRTPLVLIVGLAGAGLFYGDAMLTPAISVLSAIEGLAVLPGLTGRVEPFVMPITLGILIALFLVQRRGSGVVGAWFGPICILWFAVLGGLGLLHLSQDLSILAAINPLYAINFLSSHTGLGFIVLGSVFLTVTGAEALYADMGHFGRKPISVAWAWLVFPALALNYLGQGAMVIADRSTIGNPFFLMAPEAWRPALVLIATAATIIASQAVISGAYSLTQQAIQLGLLPRMRILQTSERHFGQIYMPQVNYLLMLGVLFMTFSFGSSSALGAAYGVSVIGTMMTSSVLAILAIWKVSKRPLWFAVLLMSPFIVIELIFAGSNLLKVFHGGIVPLIIAAGFILIMWTWVRGSALLHEQTRRDVSLQQILATLEISPPKRVRGTAIFLTADPQAAPTALLHNLKHNQVLHEQIILLSIRTAPTPRIADSERITVETIRPDIQIVTLSFGFMETPNVIRGLTLARERGLAFDIMTTSFFLSRRALVPTDKSGMPRWQDLLFIFLARNSSSATEFFHIPTSRVVELGAQVAI